MNADTIRTALLKYIAAPSVLAAAYVALGWLSYAMSALYGVGAAALWLPCGLSIACVSIYGNRMLAGVFLGEWALNHLVMHGSSIVSLALASGNAVEAFVAAALFTRFRFSSDIFAGARNFAVLVGIILVANGLSSLIGVATLWVSSLITTAHIPASLLTWWLGNFAGALTTLPLIFAWREPDLAEFRKSLHIAGYAGLLAATVTLELLIFEYRLPALFALLPFLLWSALRFGPAGTTLFGTVVVSIAMWETARGLGEFAEAPPTVAMLLMQSFTAVFMVTAFVVMSQNRAVRRMMSELHDGAMQLERKVAERTRELSRKEAHLAHAQAIARLGSWELNLATGEFYYSDETARIFGLPRDVHARYEDLLDSVHEEDRAALGTARRALAEPGGRIDLVYRVCTADGAVRYIEERGAATEPAADDALTASGTVMDITEWRANEQALEDARRRAEVANRAKSQFLANMSHEVRTPLNGILTAADLMLTSPLPREQRELAEVIQISGSGLLRIVDDILDFSKIEAGKLILSESDFRLLDLIEELLNLFRVSARTKGLTLTAHYAPDLPVVVHADALRLRQILTNLLGNAIKFTETGGVSLHVSMSREDDRTLVLRFAVDDTGIGIARERVSQLCEPFVQGDSATTRRFGGTGLGLAIVRDLVGLMGGTLAIHSELGCGSSFRFSIRCAMPQTAAEPQAPDGATDMRCYDVRSPPLAPLAADTPPAPRVLLAEDNPINRRVIQAVLSSLGYVADLVDDGAACIEVLSAKRYDLILMDCQMPNLDGYAASRVIRDRESKVLDHDVPIIALTAHAMPDDRDKCLSAGMNDYLTKPLDKVALHHALERWLGQGPAPPDEPEREASSACCDYDPVSMASRLLGDESLIREIVSSFMQDIPGRIDRLTRSAQARDAAEVRRLAHMIKGAAGNVSAVSVQHAAERIEQAAESSWAVLQSLIQELEDALQRFGVAVADAYDASSAKVEDVAIPKASRPS